MYEIFILVALLFYCTECSRVIDRDSQDGVHISDYCPESPHCVEGSHVMCMFYDPAKTMGPRCYDPQNVTMDTVLANKLMKLLNALRGRLALGKEKGLNGELLPKAYGMMKLEWDSELATFAQVLANQCSLIHDHCRATSKFHNPGQLIGSCRFTYPLWIPISKVKYTSANLTQEKLLHAMTAIVKTWYSRKDYVTPAAIYKLPDWSTTSSMPRIYLEMIYSSITHVGCGVSASTTYSYSTTADSVLNIVIVVCNLSSRPSKNHPVYSTDAPREVGYTRKCGCPPGYDEDQNCLCSKSKENHITSLKQAVEPENAGCYLKSCQPNVILLPIFTVEDAPPEKLIPPNKLARELDLDIFDTYASIGNASEMQDLTGYKQPINVQNIVTNVIHEGQTRIGYKKNTLKPILRNVQKRTFNKKPSTPKISYHSNSARALGYSPIKKTSIFSKAPIFDLNKKGDTSFKKNVQPRRDFKSVKNLVESYMNRRRSQFESQGYSASKYSRNQPKLKSEYLTSAEEKVMNYNYYLKNRVKSNISISTTPADSFTDLESSHEKSDDNLMHLLNKLEQEVKHIELDGVKREIFDAKIRKIYGAVVGDPVDLFTHKYTNKLDNDFTEYEMSDLDSDHNKYSDFEDLNHSPKNLHHKITDFSDKEYNSDNNYYERNFDTESKGRPVQKNRNSLMHNDVDKEHVRNVKKPKFNSDIHNYELKSNHESPNGEFTENIEVKRRDSYNEKAGKLKDIYSEVDERRQHNIIEKRPLEHDNFNNPLAIERRKYYQNKLDNLERKLRESRTKQKTQNGNKGRPSLPVRPTTRVEAPLRPVKTQLDPFYMADRARFLHGF